jgi:hypothetical protein
LLLGTENGWQSFAHALSRHNHNLPLVILIGCLPAILTVLLVIGRLHIPAKIGTIDLNHLVDPANPHAFEIVCHGLAQFMSQDKSGLILHVQITGERQGRFALDLIGKDGDGRKIGSQGQLM